MNKKTHFISDLHLFCDPSIAHQHFSSFHEVVGLKLHRLATKWYYPSKFAQRILHYLDSIGQGTTNGVTDVYFGQAHTQLTGYEFNGVRFHNGRAPIKGLKFKIVEAIPRQDIRS